MPSHKRKKITWKGSLWWASFTATENHIERAHKQLTVSCTATENNEHFRRFSNFNHLYSACMFVSFLFFFFLFYATLVVPLDELQKTKPDKQDHSSNYSCIWVSNVTLDDVILRVGLPFYKKAQGNLGRIVDY